MLLLSRFTVIGHSMEPAIRAGDTLFATSLPYLFSHPSVGDVVVIKKDKQFLVKRVTDTKKDAYFLSGDNSADSLLVGWVTRKEIIGKVVYKISN